MPAPDSFNDFAKLSARELIRLAYATTGSMAAAERAVEAALVRVSRFWPPARDDHDTLFTARRALAVECCRRNLGAAVWSGRLELQDTLPASSDAIPVEESQRIWDALDALSRRARITLALRFGSGLSLAETAAVLKRPHFVVERMQRSALDDLFSAADVSLPVPGAQATVPPAGILENRLGSVLRLHVDEPFDPQPLLDRVRQQARPSVPRQRPSPAICAALAAVAVTGATAVVWSVAGGNSSPAGEFFRAVPSSPVGTQLVGYGALTVAVPADWVLATSPCAQTVTDGRRPRVTGRSGCLDLGEASSVVFSEVARSAQPVRDSLQPVGEVAGVKVWRTPMERVRGVYTEVVVVPKEHLVLTARSRNRSVVAAIVASIDAVPNGFTVVPYCETLPVREAAAALDAAGLTSAIAHTSSLSTRYGEPPVTFQSRLAGSVVRAGTAVGLTIPSF